MSGGGEAPPARSQPGATGPSLEPGVLTDVVLDRDVLRSGRVIAATIAVALVLITIILLLAGLRALPGARAAAMAVCATLVATALLIGSWWRRHARMLAGNAIAGAAQCGVASAMYDMFETMYGMTVGAGLHAAPRLLVGHGHVGTTVRVCRTNEMVALEPLSHPFEPQPLNEMHSALIREQSGAGGRAIGQIASATRSVARNVAFKSGWVMLVILALDWLLALTKAIAQRTVTWHLVAFSLMLLTMLLIPADWGFRQWFVVPGAIVLRKSGLLQSHWKLHLFEHGQSVLCVSHWTRNLWLADVADAEASAKRILTRNEAEFLLRAWLSPVLPPPLERLTDLR